MTRLELTATLLVAVSIVVHPAAAMAAISVSCSDGCGDKGDDRTVNLLVLPAESDAITLNWTTDLDPAGEDASIRLYAGNPAFADVIPDSGIVDFDQSEGQWLLSRTFDVDALGRGTFLTVLVREAGNRRQILDWRAFRVISEAELQEQRDIVTSGGNWSVDISPALLQVSSGHGELPRSTGGDERVWWPLWATEGNISDADIDGSDTGVAGLGVHVSTPWHARENWRDKVIGNLKGIEGHTTKFGALTWLELPDQELSLGPGETRIDIRHYYTVITLHTNASIKAFSAKDVGKSGKARFYSHETSANLKPPKDPRFWSSYSRREYGADTALLKLLHDQVSSSSVPGLAGIQTEDGDGGSTVYRVGLVASARPWKVEMADPAEAFVAGFVAVDVVAARAGLGGIRTGDDEGTALVCRVLRCESDDKNLDLNDPPRGYSVAQPVASLDTISGKLPMTQAAPKTAQRDVPRLGEAAPVELPNLPSQTRFAVGANLRAGALIRKGGIFGTRVDNIVPINSYAQFVIKMTVAVVPDANFVQNTEMLAPEPQELDLVTKAPPRKGLFDWLGEFFNISPFAKFVMIGVIVIGLFLLVPGLRSLLSAFLNLFATAINRIAGALSAR